MYRIIGYGISCMFMIGFMMAFTVRRYPAGATIGILTAFGIGEMAMELFSHQLSDLGNTAMVCAQILLALGTAAAISEYRDGRALFTGLMASNYILAGVLLSDYSGWMIRQEWLMLVFGFLVQSGILWYLVKDLRAMYREIQTDGSGRWTAWSVVPALFVLAGLGLRQAMRESTRGWEAFLAVAVFLLTAYLSHKTLFVLISQLYEKGRSLQERTVLESATRALKREFQKLRELESQAETDLEKRRQLVAQIQALMEQEDYEGIRSLLMQMETMTEVSRPERYCANPAVNGVLVSYLAEAGQEGIPVEVRMDLPGTLRVPDWELAVVLGNLLDNAVRACRELPEGRKPLISVKAGQAGGQTLIEIRNTCREGIVFHGGTGLPVSDRGKGHGIGMQSVAYFMEKHGVLFDCGVEAEWFFARILI